MNTECHFWIHSLLGIGSANLALATLVDHVRNTLGAARIPERVSLLGNSTDGIPSEHQLASPGFFRQDMLADGRITLPTSAEKITPLVTYFSGRDGFSSHYQTLSAPLTAVGSCNSYQFSLLTVTHELSHVFVGGIMADIYPDRGDVADIEAAAAMLSPRFRPGSWRDVIRKQLLESIVSIDSASTGQDLRSSDITPRYVADLLTKWRREVQEVLVHSFDFMYFYSDDARFYVESIWHSWSAVPKIAARVPEYVLRTLCAISTRLLDEQLDTALTTSVRELREGLENLATESELQNDYAAQALRYLQDFSPTSPEGARLRKSFSARLGLARLVATFFHSSSLSARLFAEPHVTRGDTGYAKSLLTYDLRPIGNPLSFLKAHLSRDPTEAESLWVLHNLAFNTAEVSE